MLLDLSVESHALAHSPFGAAFQHVRECIVWLDKSEGPPTVYPCVLLHTHVFSSGHHQTREIHLFRVAAHEK